MTLPASGAISFNNINVELGQPGTTSANINQASYRTLAGIPSGTISLSSFYGKSNSFSFTISSNQTNANLASLATAAGWGGSSNLIATINAGVYISSNSTGTPALTVNGAFPGGVSLINNGTIVGMGGAGGSGGGGGSPGGPGSSGGLALSVASPISITNNGTVAGGGGGGGAGGLAGQASSKGGPPSWSFSAGGGGGGRSSNAANSAGGAAGPNGISGSPGGAGTVSSAGSGGSGGGSSVYAQGTPGGPGGGWGSAGSAGTPPSKPSSPQAPAGGAGPAGGAVTGNANITWVVTGTRLGGIS